MKKFIKGLILTLILMLWILAGVLIIDIYYQDKREIDINEHINPDSIKIDFHMTPADSSMKIIMERQKQKVLIEPIPPHEELFEKQDTIKSK